MDRRYDAFGSVYLARWLDVDWLFGLEIFGDVFGYNT